MGQRIICLLGSIAFGLVATNGVYLYYMLHKSKDMDDVLFRVQLESNTYYAADKKWELTRGMLALWTFGGILHSVFDLSIWYISACACCKSRESNGIFGSKLQRMARQFGSYFVTGIVAIISAVSCTVVVLRAIVEERDRTIDEDNDVDEWKTISNARSYNFLIGYSIELSLALFVYFPIIGTILFSGVLGCGTVPFLGGRPKEIKDLQKREEMDGDGTEKLDYEYIEKL